MSRLPIRWRVTLGFAVAFMVVLALAGGFVYGRVADQLSENIDDALANRIGDLAALVDSAQGERPRLDSARVDREDAFSQILDRRGQVVASTLPRGTGSVLSSAEIAATRVGRVGATERDVPGIDGNARIVAQLAFPYVIVAGASEADREETLTGLIRAFAVGAPIALLLSLGCGYLLAGRGLAPVAAMRTRAEQITLERSGERLPLPEADDEIRRLGQTLNAMLTRIETSLERERVFVADASHELRTPLAILKAEIDVALLGDKSAGELRAALRSGGEEADRLTRLAEDLLLLSRAEEGGGRAPLDQVDVTALLRVAERIGARVECPEGLVLRGDRPSLERALTNLVDNAAVHGAGEIEVSATVDGDTLRIGVRDHGPGFDAEFLPHAFERFTRGDRARTGGGAGLGLSIVDAVAKAHGGRATVSAANPGARVELVLPLSDARAGDSGGDAGAGGHPGA